MGMLKTSFNLTLPIRNDVLSNHNGKVNLSFTFSRENVATPNTNFTIVQKFVPFSTEKTIKKERNNNKWMLLTFKKESSIKDHDLRSDPDD